MTTSAVVKCPGCKSHDCRKSGWRSDVERKKHTGMRPYRCRTCHHRFWAPDFEPTSWRFAAAVVALPVMGIGMMAYFALEDRHENAPPVHVPVSGPVVIDPHTLRAAREGDAEAQLRSAKVLLFSGGRRDEHSAEAVRWLQSSAEKGNATAMVMLGKLYRSGFGVLQDYGQAVKWIQSAAERGDADGMLELGRLYRDGIGMPRDSVRAYVWFNRAAAALHAEAMRDREDIARGFTVDQLKEAQAQSSAAPATRSEAKFTKDARK